MPFRQPPTDPEERPIEHLNLTPGGYIALKRNKVHFVGELTDKTEAEIASYKGMMPQDIRIIKARLWRLFALHLKGAELPVDLSEPVDPPETST